MSYSFNNLILDTGRFTLESPTGPAAIEPQVFDLLLYLIEHRDRVVSRDELMDNIWSGKIVTDSALGTQIKYLRKAVGDDGNAQSVIKTVHGRGYQFVAELEQSDDDTPAALHQSTTIPKISDRLTIAVLPFRNISNDPDQEFFS
ncbi:MAG: winged helix-turn-helix domain-containing protein, partial [Pseudomonadota bacterium]